jgi:putative transposase
MPNSPREPISTPWPHAPEHRLSEAGTYIVTAATYEKQNLFRDQTTLKALHGGLLKYAAKYHWRLEAWAVFSNHYHFVAHSPANSDDGATSLTKFLAHFHSRSAAWLNSREEKPGRKIWHNFWETKLTKPNSYFARLNYVHQNAIKHGLVPVADQYPWCSAA